MSAENSPTQRLPAAVYGVFLLATLGIGAQLVLSPKQVDPLRRLRGLAPALDQGLSQTRPALPQGVSGQLSFSGSIALSVTVGDNDPLTSTSLAKATDKWHRAISAVFETRKAIKLGDSLSAWPLGEDQYLIVKLRQAHEQSQIDQSTIKHEFLEAIGVVIKLSKSQIDEPLSFKTLKGTGPESGLMKRRLASE